MTTIRRIVPNIYTDKPEESKQFYSGFLDMKLAMDMDWIQTYVSLENPTAQLSIFSNKAHKTLAKSSIFLSVEVADVDALHRKALQQGIDIIYPICNESWGVRRFFVKGPNGETINILSHL